MTDHQQKSTPSEKTQSIAPNQSFTPVESVPDRFLLQFATKTRPITPASILQLQRLIGNQQTQKLISSQRSEPQVQRMSLEQYNTHLQQAAQQKLGNIAQAEAIQAWVSEFKMWMNQEYRRMEKIGAFDSTELGQDVNKEKIFQRMYASVEEYIQDDAFDLKILKGHLEDYMEAQTDRQKHVLTMEGLQGEKRFKWGGPTIPGVNVRMEQEKPFRKWLYQNEQGEPGVMNCWEAVLYSAFQSGLIERWS